MAFTSALASDLMFPGFNHMFSQNVDFTQYPEEWSQIFKAETSTRQFEEENYISGFGPMPEKPEGEEVAFDDPIMATKKRFTHSNFGLAFAVSEEAFEDDLYGKMAESPRMLAWSARDVAEVQSADIFINGFTDTAANQGPDGDPLFGDGTTLDHSRLDGGRWSNQLSVAADLSPDSLELMMTLVEDTVNDRGMLQRMIGVDVIVPTELRWTAKKIIGSQKEAFVANNQINPFHDMDLSFMVWHYLTDPDAFFVKAQNHYLRFYKRKEPVLKSDYEFKTGNSLFRTTRRFSVGYLNGRGIAGSPGSN